MDHADPCNTRGGGVADGATAGEVCPQPLFDRALLAAIIQQVPSESYRFTMRRHDPTTGQMRWQCGEFGDVDGFEVLALIDRGEACLHLRDIDAILDHLDVTLPDAPIAPPKSHRLQHGLMLVSPHARTCPGATEGEGAIRVLAGRAVLLPEPDELLSTRRDQIVAFEAGAVLPWHAGPAPMLEAGEETLVVLTCQALPTRRFGELRDAMTRAMTMISSPRHGSSSGRCGASPNVTFRLVRSRVARAAG